MSAFWVFAIACAVVGAVALPVALVGLWRELGERAALDGKEHDCNRDHPGDDVFCQP